MPGREEPLVQNEYYHVYNRAITKLVLFPKPSYYHRFINTFKYYQITKTKPRFSYFLRLPESQKQKLISQFTSDSYVEILAFCLMSNHFHFLFKQTSEKGISDFISLVTNSFTRYFNTRNNRVGAIFQGRFKAVRIESEQQLLHVSRYIHLNPYSSGIVVHPKDLSSYPYSSYPDYINPQINNSYQTNLISQIFRSPQKYQEFVQNHADTQRELDIIRHLTLDSFHTSEV